MLLRLLVAVLCIAIVSSTAYGQTRPVDEDRLIRVEEGIKNIEKRLDALETTLNKRIDDLRTDMIALRQEMKGLRDDLQNFMLWGFGVTFAGIFALIGFVLWDRRTAIAPVIRETRELRTREETILTVLREYAKEDTKLIDILKRFGLW